MTPPGCGSTRSRRTCPAFRMASSSASAHSAAGAIDPADRNSSSARLAISTMPLPASGRSGCFNRRASHRNRRQRDAEQRIDGHRGSQGVDGEIGRGPDRLGRDREERGRKEHGASIDYRRPPAAHHHQDEQRAEQEPRRRRGRLDAGDDREHEQQRGGREHGSHGGLHQRPAEPRRHRRREEIQRRECTDERHRDRQFARPIRGRQPHRPHEHRGHRRDRVQRRPLERHRDRQQPDVDQQQKAEQEERVAAVVRHRGQVGDEGERKRRAHDGAVLEACPRRSCAARPTGGRTTGRPRSSPERPRRIPSAIDRSFALRNRYTQVHW